MDLELRQPAGDGALDGTRRGALTDSDVAEAMRRLFFAAALVIANASGGISDKEIETFDEFFGEGSYTGKIDLEQLEEAVQAGAQRVLLDNFPLDRLRRDDVVMIRPGDVIPTRKGLSVEIGNTDAEGRVILSDALAYACELEPDLVIDFATLTGAARIALGTDMGRRVRGPGLVTG